MDKSLMVMRMAYYIPQGGFVLLRKGYCALLIGLLLLTACQAANGSNQGNRFSGVLEGTKANVVAEVGGRITDIAVDEGDAVTPGQVVVTLDDAALRAQVSQAEAALSAAEADLAQVKAGARQETIAAAEAALQQAQAERAGALLTLSNTLQIRDNPQPINAQVDAAQAGVTLAEQNVAVMQTRLAEARYRRDFYNNDKDKRETLDKEIAIAQENLEAAQAQLDGAQAQLAALQAMRSAPVTLQVQVNQARNAYSMTIASEAVAAANVIELRAGPTLEEIALAEAKVQQAQASLKLAQAYRSRAQLAAPLKGLVAQRSSHVGETAQPGASLLSLVNIDTLDMIVYVPQAQLPRVQIGAPAKVYVDAYPDEVFTGEVVNIAQQAQFSSRDTQNKEDRANVVFAVKVRLDNAAGRLKSGMTADAELELQ